MLTPYQATLCTLFTPYSNHIRNVITDLQRLDYKFLQSCMVPKQQILYMSLNLTPKIMLFVGWPILPTLDLD